MFGKNQDDRIREWNQLIDRYISLHKYIKEVGKIGITQGRSGHLNTEVQTKIKDALTQTERTLNQLKNFFRPCLTDVDVADIFPEEKFRLEIENLNKKVIDLTEENYSLQQKLPKKPAHLTPYQLEKEIEMYLEDKKKLHEKTEQLEDPDKIQEVTSRKVSEENGGKRAEDSKQFGYWKKQEELEETLKVQNDLIYDLKHQLASTIRERENFKALNTNLGVELRKQGHFEFDYESKSDEEKYIRSQLAADYSNRSTMRIDQRTTLQNEKLDVLDKDFKNLQDYVRLNKELKKLKITEEQTEKPKVYANHTKKENDEQDVEKSKDNDSENNYDKLPKAEDKSLQDNKHESETPTVFY